MKRAIIFLLVLLLPIMAGAETRPIWVMCQPDSMVYLRARPDRSSEVVGYAYMGDELTCDGRRHGKWLHCLVSNETGEGWIREDYTSEDAPEDIGTGAFEVERNKTRARVSAGGKVRKTLRAGTAVEVYMVTAVWSVTDQGFIKTDCLIMRSKTR